MANNPYANKVQMADGTVLMDLTGDTLSSASQLLSGVTAHAKTGAPITGTWSLANNVYTVGSLWATKNQSDNPATVLGFGTWKKISPVAATWDRLKQTTTWAAMEMDNPTVYVWERTA